MLKEGDAIAKRFYQAQGSKKFNLEMEAFCKKVWEPWINAGRWILIDLTQPKTASFQVEEKPWSPEVKRDVRIYLSTLKFPHDLEINRRDEHWIGDYKFKCKTAQGIGVEKEDYDKYFSLGVPNFLLFIWANDRKRRLIHRVQNPSKYNIKDFGTELEFYDITEDCIEPAQHDVPLKGPLPKGLKRYWAWRLGLNELASDRLYPEMIEPIEANFKKVEDDFDKGLEFLESIDIPRRMTRIVLPKTQDKGPTKLEPIALKITEDRIDRMEGWDARVLKPIQAHKRMLKASILGFDTEFYEDRLLSAQLSLIDNQGNLKSKCILENLEGYDAKRLLRDALDFMLENGVQPFNRIYLIAHFSIADIGHLANHLKDFRFREINRAMHAEYVIKEDPKEKEVETEEVSLGDFKLKIIDLFAFYPSALKKIGEMVGLPKLEVDIEHILDLYDKEPKRFRKYAVRDAEITLKAFLGLRDSLWSKYGVELLKCPSIATVASNIFRIKYLHEIAVRYADITKYQSYRTKKGEWSKRRVKESRYAGSLDLRKLALLCYWGGRAESYVHGFIEGKFKLYDVASLYPSASMLQPLPSKETEWIAITERNMKEKALEGYVCVKFEFPESTRYPCLPVHGLLNDRLYFPLSGISYCTMSEVREALRLGCGIKNIYGYGFIASKREIDHDLKAFMKDMLRLKAQSPKGSLEYETHKLIANALIGKLAQRRPEDNLDYAQELFIAHGVPLDRKPKGREKVGSAWAPEWASLILGKSRALMSQFINKGALMTVTDSVLLPSDANIECEALNELRLVGSDLVAEPYEVESSLLVRTRLYALMDGKGKIVKEAHHAVHLSPDKVKEIFKKALKLGRDPDIEGLRDHLIGLREALRTGKPLGSAEPKPSRIYFRWDWKRNLANPALDMFRESSDSEPIKDVVSSEADTFEVMKHQRAKAKRGRPRAYSLELEDRVRALKQQGNSYREIAKALGISLGKVQRILDRNREVK